MKVFLVGIDGAEWEILKPLLSQGELPTFSKLIKEGSYGDLQSVTPPISPPAWASILTGVNPGKHGIFDFIHYDEEYNSFPINNSHLQAPTIWEILNDNNITTGLINVPLTYPPTSLSGYLISGMLTPGDASVFSYPADLSKCIGNYSEWRTGGFLIKKGYRSFINDMIRKEQSLAKFTLSQLKASPTDFSMVVFDGTDRLQHFLWKYWDPSHPRFKKNTEFRKALIKYYKGIDRFLAELIKLTGKDVNVLIVSDHGFRRLHTDFYIEEWLKDKGFLKVKPRVSQNFDKTVRKGTQVFNRIVTRLGIRETLKDLLPEKIQKKLRDLNHVNLTQNIDWSKTKAFFTSLSGQALKINFQNRKKIGAGRNKDYESVREDLKKELLKISDNTRNNVIRKVHAKEVLYSGPFVPEAPDLLIECASGYTCQTGYSENYFKPSIQYNRDRSGDHSPEGVFIAWGSKIKERGKKVHANIMDIAPTVFHLFNVKIPEFTDGEVLSDILNKGYLENHEIDYTENYNLGKDKARVTKTEEETIKEHLKGLGYL